jgi:hypothetical protein
MAAHVAFHSITILGIVRYIGILYTFIVIMTFILNIDTGRVTVVSFNILTFVDQFFYLVSVKLERQRL